MLRIGYVSDTELKGDSTFRRHHKRAEYNASKPARQFSEADPAEPHDEQPSSPSEQFAERKHDAAS
jgi:hypothetical protein